MNLRRVKIGHRRTGRLEPEETGRLSYKLRRLCKQQRQSRFENASELKSTDHHQTSLRDQEQQPGVRFNNNGHRSKPVGKNGSMLRVRTQQEEARLQQHHVVWLVEQKKTADLTSLNRSRPGRPDRQGTQREERF